LTKLTKTERAELDGYLEPEWAFSLLGLVIGAIVIILAKGAGWLPEDSEINGLEWVGLFALFLNLMVFCCLLAYGLAIYFRPFRIKYLLMKERDGL
jgi:hypothetical protein